MEEKSLRKGTSDDRSFGRSMGSRASKIDRMGWPLKARRGLFSERRGCDLRCVEFVTIEGFYFHFLEMHDISLCESFFPIHFVPIQLSQS